MDIKKEDTRNSLFKGTGKIVFGDRFVGRTNALRQIRNRVVEGHGNISVIGMPRVGKTSLVWECLMTDRSRLVGDYKLIPVFIESASVASEFEYIKLLVDETCQEIEDIISEESCCSQLDSVYTNELCQYGAMLSADKSPVENANIFKKFFRKLCLKAEFGVIFILDEFDHTQKIFGLETFQLLRELSINPKARVSFVTTSRKSIEEIESKDGAISNFHGTFVHLYLGLFNDEDMNSYWTRLDSVVPIPEDIKNNIIKIVGSHPYFLDLCCIQYLYNEQIDDLFSSDFKMKIYAEFHQIIDILKRDELINATIQLVVGPPMDVRAEQLDRLLNFGIIDLISFESKAKLLHLNCNDYEKDRLSYVLFGDFFTKLFYTKYFLDVPYWPLWGKTENKLREIILFFVKNRYGEHWIQEIEHDNQNDPTWLANWDKMKTRYEENKDLNIDNHTSSPIDFTETGHIYYQFIKKYWNLWFSTVFTETQEDIEESQRLNKKVNPFYGWARKFDKLIQIRRPFAHNNSGILTQEEINLGKQYCDEILQYIAKWENGNKVMPEKYESDRKLPTDQLKVGIYDAARNRVVVSSGEWKYFYEVRSSIDNLYDGAEVEFVVSSDSNNPRFKIALNVTIR